MSDTARLNEWLIEDVRLQRQDTLPMAPERLEFPITPMGLQLADALLAHAESQAAKNKALDVGTGTGFHSFLLAAAGFDEVHGIDINEPAVEAANERARRLTTSELEHGAGVARQVRFHVGDVRDISKLNITAPVDLMCINPPAYVPFFSDSNGLLEGARGRGVFVDPAPGSRRSEHTLTHRFFKHAVLPYSREGTHIFCTWPGLDRRLVELEPNQPQPGEPQHPAVLLQQWFGIEIACSQPSMEGFYNKKARITDYALGPGFWERFDAACAQRLYSSLVTPLDLGHRGKTFRYGVLHLRCTATKPLHFEVVDHVEGPA